MATAAKEDILLRQEANAPLTTKGSAFTFKELDDNFITLYNQLVSLSGSSNVDAWSASKTYVGGSSAYVMISNQLYKLISASDSLNETPASYPLVWQKVYASDLVQAPNNVKKFSKLIPSADVLALGITDTPIALIEAQGVNKVIVPLSIMVTMQFGTTAYATNTTLMFYNGGIDVAAGESPNATESFSLLAEITKTSLVTFSSLAGNATRDDNPANNAFNVAVSGGNPTDGDSAVLITGTYTVIDIS